MGDVTGIEWTDKSWNPWMGCTKVSAGCEHCYMFRDLTGYGRDPSVVTRSKTTFTAPLKWKEPALVFTCSWSDWFHKDADPWRAEAWAIVKRTPHLTYQILTKRTGRIRRHLPVDWGDGYPNVWLGTTVEDQDAVFRVRHLLNTPARTRFLSCEPLLGALDLSPYSTGIDWAIVGGESGPQARPMPLDAARGIIAWGKQHRIAIFVKQLGGHPNKRHDPAAWPRDLRVRQMPKGRGEAARQLARTVKK